MKTFAIVAALASAAMASDEVTLDALLDADTTTQQDFADVTVQVDEILD